MSETGYDFAYLKETVGDPLTKALAKLALMQPEDPVDFVGHYLLNHVANVRREAELCGYAKEKAFYETKREAKGISEAEEKEQAALTLQKQLDADVNLEASLRKASCSSTLNALLMNKIQEVTKATSVVLGKKVTDTDQVIKIHWLCSAPAASSAINRFVTEETGVTFDALKEEVDENAQVDEEGNMPAPKALDFIHIPNVIRDDRVLLYGIPKLGAYAAKGIKYKSYLHDTASLEEDVETWNPKEAWLVVSIDSLGQSRAFTDVELSGLTKWGTIYGESVQALEERQLRLEIQNVTTNADVMAVFSEAYAVKMAEHEEGLLAHIETVPEDEKETKTVEMRFVFTKELMVEHVKVVQALAHRVRPFVPQLLSTIGAFLCILGSDLKEVCNPATTLPDWDQIRTILRQDDLQSRLESYDPSTSSVHVQSLMEGTTLAEVQEQHAVIGLIHAWNTSAMAASDIITAAQSAALEA